MKVDQQGNVYCTGPGGVHVMAPDGTLLGRLRVPGVAPTWPGATTIGARSTSPPLTSVFRTRLKIPGVAVW